MGTSLPTSPIRYIKHGSKFPKNEMAKCKKLRNENFVVFRVSLQEGVLRILACAAPSRTQHLLEYTGLR